MRLQVFVAHSPGDGEEKKAGVFVTVNNDAVGRFEKRRRQISAPFFGRRVHWVSADVGAFGVEAARPAFAGN